MENKTWIKLYRKIKEKAWYQKSQYVHLWVHILIKAEHEEKEFLWNGQTQKTIRGQFLTGRNKLVQETGIPATTIEDILKLFEKDGQIRQQKNNKFRLITVLNYKEYQTSDIKPTSSRHLADIKPTHNKNTKNNKEQKENIATSVAVSPDDDIGMDYKGFVDWCSSSPQRAVKLIGEWADTTKPSFQTKGQWRVFMKRNLRASNDLAKFTDKQIEKAFTEIQQSKDWLKKPTLETILKFLN